MLIFQSEQLDFVSFVLSFFLEAASSGGQLVLLLSWLRPHCYRQLAHGSHVIDDSAKLVKFFSNTVKLLWVWSQIIAVTFAGLATRMIKKNYYFIVTVVGNKFTCALFLGHCSWGWKLGQWLHSGCVDLPALFSIPIAVLWALWLGHCTAKRSVLFSCPLDDHLFRDFLLLHHLCL